MSPPVGGGGGWNVFLILFLLTYGTISIWERRTEESESTINPKGKAIWLAGPLAHSFLIESFRLFLEVFL